MGACLAVEEKPDTDSRRLTIAKKPEPTFKLPPYTQKEGTIEHGKYKFSFCCLSMAGTYPKQSANPFKGVVKYKTNQDNYLFVDAFNNKQSSAFIGVMDGHGPFGHDVSKYISDNLPVVLAETMNQQKIFDPPIALTEAFKTLDTRLKHGSHIDVSLSGSTCVTCYINDSTIYCANCGDSRCVLGYIEDDEYKYKDLSLDHKPNVPEERNRIISHSGRVGPVSTWSSSCLVII
eukprot:c12925_g1_i1.p1 GENE.c12925_g1_i1~~c12925_g1_i1.p1  ORF type:complete len:233 (-),score=68.52 c12925_g1_i1:75-773(-)